MNIEQWKERFRVAKTRSEMVKLQDNLTEELRSKGEKLKTLSRHAGWKVIEEYFDSKDKLIRDQLELAPIDKVVDLQKELKAQKDLRTFMNNMILNTEVL